MNRPIARASAVALLSLIVASCNNDTGASPTPNPTTETFTGTLGPGQKMIHPYELKAAGTVYTTLTALSGVDYIGVGSGTWDGKTCTVAAHTENMAPGNSFGASVPSPQNLCVVVYDVGVITSTASYTLTVAHP
ncbi:MAG: hypothetical protein ACM3H9_09280 [Rhodospirillaceae bacterium]